MSIEDGNNLNNPNSPENPGEAPEGEPKPEEEALRPEDSEGAKARKPRNPRYKREGREPGPSERVSPHADLVQREDAERMVREMYQAILGDDPQFNRLRTERRFERDVQALINSAKRAREKGVYVGLDGALAMFQNYLNVQKRKIERVNAAKSTKQEPTHEAPEEVPFQAEAIEKSVSGEEALPERKEAIAEEADEFEAPQFESLKTEHDPLVNFLLDKGFDLELGKDVVYEVEIEKDGKKSVQTFTNWHDAKKASEGGTARAKVNAAIAGKFLPYGPAAEFKGEFDELMRKVETKELADAYAEAVRSMKEGRERAWASALDVETDPEIQRNEDKMAELDPVRKKLKAFGLSDEEIQHLDPYYVSCLRVDPNLEADYGQKAATVGYKYYHYLLADRAQMDPKRRLEVDQVVLPDLEDPNGEPWQKITVTFKDGWNNEILKKLTRNQLMELYKLADVDIRHETLPDEYAEWALSQKPARMAEKEPETATVPEPAPYVAPEQKLEKALDESPAPPEPVQAEQSEPISESAEAKLVDLKERYAKNLAEKKDLYRERGIEENKPDGERDETRIDALTQKIDELFALQEGMEQEAIKLLDNGELAALEDDYRKKSGEFFNMGADVPEDEKQEAFERYQEAFDAYNSRYIEILNHLRPEPQVELGEGANFADIRFRDEGFRNTKEENEAKLSREYGISAGDLQGIEGWSDLNAYQQKLCVENLAQLTLARIQEEAADRHIADTAKTGKLGKFWNGVTKQYQIAKNKKLLAEDIKRGGISVHGEVLKQLVRGAKDLEVREGADGKLHIDVLPASLMETVNGNRTELTPEERLVVEEFNIAAQNFARTPSEWGYPTGRIVNLNPDGDFLRSERLQYFLDEKKLESLRGQVIDIRRRKNGMNEAEAVIFMNDVERKIWTEQFFNVHPDAEKRLMELPDESPLWAALKDSITERGIFLAAGGITRTVATGFIGLAGAPLAAMGLGALRGWMRGKGNIREREMRARRGAKMSQDIRPEEAQIKAHKEEIEKINRDIAEARLNREKLAPEDVERRIKSMEAERARAENAIGRLTMDITDKEHFDRDFVSSALLSSRMNLLERELLGGEDPKLDEIIRKVEDEGRALKEQAERDPANAELSVKLEANESMLEKYRRMRFGTDDPEKRAEIVRRLEVRLNYTQDKLDQGLVKFGLSGKASEQGIRIGQQMDLIRSLTRAAILIEQEKAEHPELFGPERIVTSDLATAKRLNVRRDREERLDAFLKRRSEMTRAAQRRYKKKEAVRGAIFGGAFAAAGVAFAEIFRDPNLSEQVDAAFKAAGDAPEAAKEKALEAIRWLGLAYEDAASKAEEAAESVSPQAAEAPLPGKPAGGVPKKEFTFGDIVRGEPKPEAPMPTAGPEVPLPSRSITEAQEGEGFRFKSPAEAAGAAEAVGQPAASAPETLHQDAQAAAGAAEAPKGDTGTWEKFDKYKSDPDTARYVREMKSLENAIERFDGPEDAVLVRRYMEQLRDGFEKNSLLAQEDAVKRLEVLKEKLDKLPLTDDKFRSAELQKVRDMISNIEGTARMTKDALYEKLKSFGFGVDQNGGSSYDRIIKNDPSMTVGMIREAYKQGGSPFVKWVVEDRKIGLATGHSSPNDMHIDEHLRAHFKLETFGSRFRSTFTIRRGGAGRGL